LCFSCQVVVYQPRSLKVVPPHFTPLGGGYRPSTIQSHLLPLRRERRNLVLAPTKAHLGKPRAAKPRVLASFWQGRAQDLKDPKTAELPKGGPEMGVRAHEGPFRDRQVERCVGTMAREGGERRRDSSTPKVSAFREPHWRVGGVEALKHKAPCRRVSSRGALPGRRSRWGRTSEAWTAGRRPNRCWSAAMRTISVSTLRPCFRGSLWLSRR